ncbi:hypothetical protein COY25_03195 [Candidatus Uhrbacteria bacterium CG_4_10_14_0_2_um_filter_41_7]|uniref:LysM domain-containing protein n=1 Tax=Candidatus Uhrbacteria bacterium CG_4_9_14_3_um_filter_41_35 TaxID=1975034 RepID=A0A2M7XDH4_9BACT|nr:MAG: hypothetical protein COV92_03630 [Candidatus Uhrbacteria bacterium CG11_big_fil_rev_8_21_14_0_20_41_9]PIZ53638.1 MAG: hypothetical protein COY25_03195 [Candidatus Uhrbacteria bacterium CG_4_10_14_0_2_um_filter_41_7]PJA45895.1 MAG: hypothetical protein CO173_04250 [Candidatus Uhrbacteria bacterium CG_4_9_14_3_um_filter_41_35]
MVTFRLLKHYISDKAKQFIVSGLLKAVRLLVKTKPHLIAFIYKVFEPLAGVGRFLMHIIVLPAYRLLYNIRRHFDRLYGPARNKFMILVTNRYSIHVIIGTIAIITGILNLQTGEVRAETFGERSLMYGLVTKQQNTIVEEYAYSENNVERLAVNYRESNALSPSSHGLLVVSQDNAISPLTAGTIASPVISKRSDSVAPREEIIEYVMVSGDSLSTIAEKFGISVNTLLWSNDLTIHSVLKPGKTLTILPVSGVKHEVKTGDTITKIAKTYNVEESAILEYNKLASADDLVIGESLIIPGGEVKAPEPPKITKPVVPATIATPGSTSAPSYSTKQPTTTASGSMVWPTDLHIITQYFGWNHTGIDIDCHFTENNYASDDGVVQFAGWKGGYGYAVEINHGKGLVTRYGHHAQLYVEAGQTVTKGTPLGLCGTTGRSTGTHLHFEVILNGKFKNPLEYVR